MFLARSFPVSLKLAVMANSCSSDSNRMLENPSAACPMRNRLSLYVDYCKAFCALAKNFVLVMANSCSSGSNGTLENPSAAFPCEIGSRCYVNYRMAFCVFAKNSALVIAYTLVNAFTRSAYISCKVIPSFSATRREGKFVLFW